jgi:predicted ArsR family transcriptional regulator
VQHIVCAVDRHVERGRGISHAQLAKFRELRNTYVVKNIRDDVSLQHPEDKTRDLVARTILENGPLSATEIATKLQLTPAGIRRHLDSLVTNGTLVSREPYRTATASRGRGRPTKVFVITDLGRERFEHSYDDLAASALRFMANLDTLNNSEPTNLVKQFAISWAREMERRFTKVLGTIKIRQRKVEALANFLIEEGFAATTKRTTNGIELCQHHCPIAHVASEFPELCEAETRAFSTVLGTHVQRLATIADGSGVCTTYIPLASSSTAPTFQSTITTQTTRESAHD